MRVCILFIFWIVIGCSIPDRDTPDFGYIQIDSMGLNEQSSAFSDAWMYKDGEVLGVYELPRRIPIANATEGLLNIRAGIRQNGINSMPAIYPFVGIYSQEINIENGDSITISPVFQYLKETVIRMDANFEGRNDFGYDEDGIDSLGLVLTSEGKGLIKVPPKAIVEEATSFVYNEFPKNGSPIYIEIEYMGNIDLDIGLIGITGTQIFKDYFVSLRSTTNWKKAYINITDLILTSGLQGYQVLLGVDNASDVKSAEIYVDNIKLLHF